MTPHVELEEELVSVFRNALKTAGFIGGPMVEEFEQEFSQFCEARHCVGVGSGTDALRFALIAAGVRPGDTVITVPNTFIATTEAISQAGGHPDFVDIEQHTYNIDVQKLHEYIETQCRRDSVTGQLLNRRTGSPLRGIVPVHLYGQMADMDAILQIADQHRLFVVEDACQAHGATYYSRRENCWKKAGSMGTAGAFSFYPGKNLGACGEAGAVTTNDPKVAAKVRVLRDHGQSQKYSHDIEGYNGRLDAIQAGILRAKLKRLAEWNQKRRVRARRYGELLRSWSDKIVLPYESPVNKAVYHLYVIRIRNRDQVQDRLAKANVATQIHYPTPLHLQRAYAMFGYKEGDFPIAEKWAAEILSLPMYPQLDLRQQKLIVQKLMDALACEISGGANPNLEPAAAPESLAH